MSRPRRFCREPGARPIGRRPGVHDKPTEALGTIFRYSTQILICFIAYISDFQFLCGLGLEHCISGLPQCPLPLSIVIRMRLLIRQSNLPACLAWSKLQQYESTLWHLCHRNGETDRKKMIQSISMGRFSVQKQSELTTFHTCKQFDCISARNLDWFQQCWISSSPVVLKMK